MIPILFGLYWSISGFSLFMIIASKRAVGGYDLFMSVLTGGIILPAAFVANIILKEPTR